MKKKCKNSLVVSQKKISSSLIVCSTLKQHHRQMNLKSLRRVSFLLLIRSCRHQIKCIETKRDCISLEVKFIIVSERFANSTSSAYHKITLLCVSRILFFSSILFLDIFFSCSFFCFGLFFQFNVFVFVLVR